MKSHKELEVWRQAMELAKMTYQWTSNLPKDEVYGLRAQMRSAAVSIPSTIAEGYARNHRPEYLHALAIAAGSLAELETQSLIAVDCGHLPHDPEFAAKLESVGRLLTALRAALRTTARVKS